MSSIKRFIVIPCKNEGRGVIDILKLIRRQQLDCQVIIADSSDDEETLLNESFLLQNSMLEDYKYDLDFEKYSSTREFKKLLLKAKNKK